jgi:uncharacterized protein YndB with AHSA1/START domain
VSVSASTVVAAPPAAVFDILADPRRHPEIDGSGTVTGSVSGPDRLELGSTFGMDMKQGASYQTKNTVVEFEEGRRIAWRHFSPHVWRYELAAQDDGTTEVTETWDLSQVPAPVRLFLSLAFKARTRRGIEQTLVKLKALAEQDPAA